MNSKDNQLLLILRIVFASLTGGIVSLISLRGNTPYWQDRDFWIVSVSSHCFLIAIALWIYREKPLNLNTREGHLNTFTLALISSVTVLILFVFGMFVPLGLIFTGRALLTGFVATYVHAFLTQ